MAEAATDKQVKREARQLRDAARHAFDAGDYQSASRLDARIVAMAPESEPGREAAAEARNLAVDSTAIYIGLGTIALYALAWVVAL